MKVTLDVIEGPHQGRSFTFSEHDTFIVGRARYAHFHLQSKDQYFSRAHFMVEVNPPLCRLMDMASTNGTFVNQTKVSETDLKHNDLIEGGDTVIRVRIEGGGARATNRLVGTGTSGEPDASASGCAPGGSRLPLAARLESLNLPDSPSVPETHPSPPPTVEPESFSPADALTETFTPTEQPPPPPSKEPAEDSSPSPTARLSTGIEPDSESPAPTGERSAVPDKFGRFAGYHFIRKLGSGGMGTVYQAVREADGETIALKTIKPGGPVSERDVAQFLREVAILRDLDHPHIVRFFESGEHDGRLYFVMEHVPGSDAAQLVKRNGPMPAERAVGIACQLLDALDYAHKKQFVHRDIKPNNLLIRTKGGSDVVKLADFGLARAYHSTRFSGLTLQGEMGGSIAFMPPEHITNYREAKPPGDLYSVAATLYNLLSGKHVYDFPKAVSEGVLLILQEKPIPITDRLPDLRPGLATAIHRGLARNPQQRFPNARAMRQALLPFAR